MSEALLMERYKYILDQKKRLNEATFKIAAFFQAAILVILGGQFRVIELAQKKEITVVLAELSSWGLFAATLALSAVSLLLLIGGVASWFDYRKEEVEIEGKLGWAGGRVPSLRGVFRWFETYIGLIILLVAPAYLWVLQYIIMPTLHV